MPDKPDNIDPYVYASILGGLIQDRNPIQALVGDIQRMVKVVANLQKTRKMAQARINQLQQQVDYMESNIAKIHPKTHGHRIDKLR